MLFDKQIARKPDLYPWTKDFIKVMWQGFWTPEEFDFNSDIQDFKVTMTEEERRVIVRTVSAIAQIEVAVKRFWSRLGDKFDHPSIVDLGITMANVETIHNVAYEKLLDVLGLQKVFEENLNEQVIKGRVEYLNKHLELKFVEKNTFIDNLMLLFKPILSKSKKLNSHYNLKEEFRVKQERKQFIYSLILFTVFVENISLFSQFYIILWFNRFNNVLQDTSNQVNYTLQEENIHYLVGVELIKTLRKEYPELFDSTLANIIQEEVVKAYYAECKVINWILQGFAPTDEMNPSVVEAFIGDRMNSSMKAIGFEANIPVDKEKLKHAHWMREQQLARSQPDFFHRRSTAYAKHTGSFRVTPEWFPDFKE